MEPLTPTYTASLFPPLHAELMQLLRALRVDDWSRETVAPAWRVRDIAAHLLDVDLRKLSGARDGHRMASPRQLRSFDDIVDLINDQNGTGASYAARLSPRIITDLLEVTGPWVSDFVAALPPHAEAGIGVAWAGESRSENWMDIGREYTERWHHQMQIRDAVGAAGLLHRRWLYPLFDLSVRAFPRAFHGVQCDMGTAIVFGVNADSDYVWSLVRDATGWRVVRGAAAPATTEVWADVETAWKVLYNALPPEVVRARVTITGDGGLAERMLRARSVMVHSP